MEATRREPALQELLDDPTIQAVMRRDGLERDELENLLRVARTAHRWTGRVRVPRLLIEGRPQL